MYPKSKHVKVVIRTRPTSSFAQGLIQFGEDKKSVHIHVPKNEEWGYINNQQENWDFKFDSILNNASQESVYEECGEEIVKSVLNGYNGTILAYGQTGAGKTFTMTGASENYKHRGLIPRAISHLFRDITDKPHLAVTVRISYLEVYNEQMIDLLLTVNEENTQEIITVVEERNGSAYVKGLTIKTVNNEEEALNLLFEGETNRSISEHQMNRNSSRSHCIFTIYVESRSRVESSEKVMTSKLNLVDLAGSERLSKTETTGVSLKEAMYINRSLTYLEQVIIALADKKREHVPFRQSKMTHVLRDALGGNCNTLMIANIWGQKEHIEETISTLRFATRMMCVSVSPEVNVHYDPLALIKKYEKEIKDLKQELSLHDSLANRSLIQYEPYTEDQKMELTRQIKKYIESESDEIEIINIRQIKEAFMIFRLMIKNLQDSDVSDLKSSKPNLIALSQDPTSAQRRAQNDQVEKEDGVGDVEGTGFGIGIAPGKANQKAIAGQPKPPKKKESEELEEVKDPNIYIDHTANNPAMNRDRKLGATLSRAEEFEEFKRSSGAELNQILTENKMTLKAKKQHAKELAKTVNDLKHEIDILKESLEKSNTLDGETILDQTEYQKIQTLKHLKEEYKRNYEALKPLRVEIDHCFKITDQSRQKLMSEFEQWYETLHGPQFKNSDHAIDEVLDIGEKFDRLQMERMALEDPDSLPFYNAKKNSDRKVLKGIKKPVGKPVAAAKAK